MARSKVITKNSISADIDSNSSKVKHAMGDVIKKCDASELELELDEVETVSSH